MIAISACLAGEVCGDHCSPISVTTIMVSAVGYLIAGLIGYFADSPAAMAATPITLMLLAVVVIVVSKRQGKKENV